MSVDRLVGLINEAQRQRDPERWKDSEWAAPELHNGCDAHWFVVFFFFFFSIQKTQKQEERAEVEEEGAVVYLR